MRDRDAVIFRAGVDLSALQNLFECVSHQAQILLLEGDQDTEKFGLILDAVAEKGIREAGAAMGRLKPRTHAARSSKAPAVRNPAR